MNVFLITFSKIDVSNAVSYCAVLLALAKPGSGAPRDFAENFCHGYLTVVLQLSICRGM
jgi:hypothetical protein